MITESMEGSPYRGMNSGGRHGLRKALEEAYSEVAHELKDRLALNPAHWENPKAFDVPVDKLYRRGERRPGDLECEEGNGEVEEVQHDPLADPELPMPIGLRDRIDEDERHWKKERESLPARLKIRQARPGQSPPEIHDEGEGADRCDADKKSA